MNGSRHLIASTLPMRIAVRYTNGGRTSPKLATSFWTDVPRSRSSLMSRNGRESALRPERRLQAVHETGDRPPWQEGDQPGEHAVPRAGDDDPLVGLPRPVAHLGDHGGRHRRSPVPGEPGLPGAGAL